MTKEKLNITLAVILMIGILIPALWIKLDAFLPDIYVAGVEQKKTPEGLSWLDGTQQKQIEQEIFDTLSIRAAAIRIRNQYQYSLFKKLNAQQIYEYNDYFYRFYMDNYREDLYVNSDSINNQILDDLVEFKSLLREDCPIISIIAPSKARLFPEYLPEKNITRTKHTNYDFFKNGLLKYGITCLDFNDYFLKNKNSFDAAIIAKGGIHWTFYGTSIAMDSLVSTVELLKKTKYNHFSTVLSDCGGFNDADQDISVLCNLIERKYDPNIKHVEFIQAGTPRKKINALIIGDSFFSTVENSDLRKLIFTENTDYLYYFERSHSADMVMSPIDIEKIKKQLKEVDCVIFLNDLVNMEKFTFGFPRKMIEELKKDSLKK